VSACRLCGGEDLRRLEDLSLGAFDDCPRCGLLSRATSGHLSLVDERAFYGTHENSVDDPRYRSFVGRAARPLLPLLKSGAKGLDFGSGPAPALAEIFREKGFATEALDPFFGSEKDGEREAIGSTMTVREGAYDFITCTEVAEHFRQPGEEFARLFRGLAPEGYLVVMTEWYRDQSPLRGWRYARDPTHVAFYRRSTFEWLASTYGASLTFAPDDVCLFQKRAASFS
jgi:Methyltransferase domain